MMQWELVTSRNFPIWTISRRIVERRKLRAGRIQWVVEIPDNVRILPTAAGIVSVSAVDRPRGIAA